MRLDINHGMSVTESLLNGMLSHGVIAVVMSSGRLLCVFDTGDADVDTCDGTSHPSKLLETI
jgi:hypothetical protein